MTRGFAAKLGSVLASWGLFESEPPQSRDRRELRLYLPVEGQRLWVGSLWKERGEYVFRYSQDFKHRDDLPVIAAFPDKEQEVRSRHLWPFFLARIPSTSRPEVEELLRQRHIDPEDKFLLLAEFGRKAISTPYELELASAIAT